MGMNTIITEGSATISGGQKQRLLIARAVAPRPGILMFDEATSALDNITQKSVSDALDNMKCTRIVIAHRLSTILAADEILVVKDGTIAERGSHKELLSKEGIYRELYETQFSKAIMEEGGVSELEQYIWGTQPADEPFIDEFEDSGK